MVWRAANSILGLISAVNALAPGRSTISDGTIGDTAHAARKSDHNPNDFGVVTAVDLTHDPVKGADMHQITEFMRLERDPRIKYVIWDGRMFASYQTVMRNPWEWGNYSGTNQHRLHSHTSVVSDPKVYDQTGRWTISESEVPPVAIKIPNWLKPSWDRAIRAGFIITTDNNPDDPNSPITLGRLVVFLDRLGMFGPK